MGQIINVNFKSSIKEEYSEYKEKLIRIRDDIENYLDNQTSIENDDLAIALAAGRYATMKLVELTGQNETINFVNDCIKTSLKNKYN
tara:strand:+ start:221 stop:481 length:261 start_codon:yes stop_codon:yes gene_type:complete